MAVNKEVERRLSVFYISGSVASLILIIMMAIVWNYWKYTLNSCIGVNCGCILYATTTYNAFIGSDVSICRFITFAPIFSLIWGLFMGISHVYRLCFVKIKEQNASRRNRRTVVTFSGDQRPNERHRKSPMYICLFVVSLSFVFLFIAISIILTDGYFSTCKGYKKSIVKQLSASGNLALMIFDRMTCGTTLDFLDYMQTDPSFLESRFRRGTYLINTGLFLQISIISAWFSVFSWSAISVYNFFLIFKRKDTLHTLNR